MKSFLMRRNAPGNAAEFLVPRYGDAKDLLARAGRGRAGSLSAQNGGGEGRWARSRCPAGGKGCLGRRRSPSRCWPGGWELRRWGLRGPGRQSRWWACQGGDRRCHRPASRCFAGWRAVGPVVGRCPTGCFAGWRFAGDPAGCRPVCRFAGWRPVCCFAGRWPVDRFAVS